MPTREPHDVLGVERGASQATIKAAWRRLAREHHPDVSGPDPASARAATRRMAMINAAYEELRDGWGRRRGVMSTGRADEASAAGTAGTRHRTGGPPRPRPTRPVTGRVDTADTFRARNRTTTRPPSRTMPPGGPPSGGRSLGGHAAGGRSQGESPPPQSPPLQPPRSNAADREPPRASDPTGPLRRSRLRAFKPPDPPAIDAANALELEFGKFRGHTLGQVAAFEPSYIDWIASTITRDAGLVAAARVLRDDLDRRGVVRRRRETERQRLDRLRQQREWTRIFGDAP